jgi:epoxyqueuosine reductase
MDRKLTGDLRGYLIEQGSDMVGFGSVDRLAGAPVIMAPRRYLPDALSLISIAIRINEAACDLIARSVRERHAPPSYYSYQVFTLNMINSELDRLAYLGAGFLEQRGFRAYPFPANLPHTQKPSTEYPGGPGDISHRHAAVACGLGEIGWHNLFISPRYGTRQKLTTIITNAALEEDELTQQTRCDPETCGFQCACACPTSALPKRLDRKVAVNIGGKDIRYGKLTGWRCRWGCSGMLRITGGYKDIPMPSKEPDPQELLEYKAQVDPWQERLKIYSGLLPYCGRCLAICPLPN